MDANSHFRSLLPSVTLHTSRTYVDVVVGSTTTLCTIDLMYDTFWIGTLLLCLLIPIFLFQFILNLNVKADNCSWRFFFNLECIFVDS